MSANLITKPSDLAFSYYCTWQTQNFGRPSAIKETNPEAFIGGDGAEKARDFLNEKHMTEQKGLLSQYDAVRGDLYFLLDDGWDVAYGVHPATQREQFGSLEVAEDRFPSCTGNPAERLKSLNDLVKKAGWRGLGIWVSAQAKGESGSHLLDRKESDAYWKERLRWSQYAGVAYWKVDWGARQEDIAWRKHLDELRAEIYPELVIEHCLPIAPGNNVVLENGRQVSSGRFSEWWNIPQRSADILMQGTQVFRTYDVLPQFSQVSTMDRIAVLLQEAPQSPAILNCEDEAYIGAAMGCSIGVMRSSLNKELPVYDFDPQRLSHKTTEIRRAVRWQYLAPPFPIQEAKTYVSRETVVSRHYFGSAETWMSDYIHKEVMQTSPSWVSRGMPLERIVYDGDRPLLAASRHPNGAVAVAALSYLSPNGRYETPLCTLTLPDVAPGAPVGIFGYFQGVEIAYTAAIEGKRIYAQDLAEDRAEDITACVRAEGNRLFISGEILNRIGMAAQSDESDPGLVVCLK